MRQVGDVQTMPRQDVAVAERIVLTIAVRVKPFVDVNVHVPLDVFQARITYALSLHVDAAFYMEKAIDVTQFHPNRRRIGELRALEFLDVDRFVDEHDLPAAAEQATDIDPMRSVHTYATRRMGAPPGLAGPPHD